MLPGDCFLFTAQAEFDDHPGAVRSRVAEVLRDWEAFIRRLVEEVVELGGHVEPVQVYFDDLDAMGLLHDSR